MVIRLYDNEQTPTSTTKKIRLYSDDPVPQQAPVQSSQPTGTFQGAVARMQTATPAPVKEKRFFDKVKSFFSGAIPAAKELVGFGGVTKLPGQFSTASQPLVEKTFNTKIGKAIATNTGEATTDIIPKLWYASKSLGSDKAFFDAYSTYYNDYKTRQEVNSKDDRLVTRIAKSALSSAPQSALGVALSFVPVAGKPLATAYWAAISAEEQIKSDGKVTSLNKIAIDVIGDRMLGDAMEGMFKSGAKILTSTLKSAGIEGTTEVAQTLLKLQNDYLTAGTDEERSAILERAKQYFTSGDIAVEFGAGVLSGAGIGAAGNLTQSQVQVNVPTNQSEPQQPTIPPPPPPPGASSRKAPIRLDFGPSEAIAPKVDSGNGDVSGPNFERSTKPGTEGKQKFASESPLLSEARKYKTAEEFVGANGTTTNGIKHLPIDQYNTFSEFMKDVERLNKLPELSSKEILKQIDAAKAVWGGKVSSLAPEKIDITKIKLAERPLVNKPSAGRTIGSPIEVMQTDKGYTLIDGRHRLDQAIANGETKIDAVVKDKSQVRQLTSLWNEAQKGESEVKKEKPSQPTKPKPPETPEKETFKSRVLERLQSEYPDLEGEANAERVRLQENLDAAVDLVIKDKQLAFDIAMGRIQDPNVLQTSASIALFEKALEEGNMELAGQLAVRRSLDQARRGQELVAERGSVSDNSTSKYVKLLIASRLDNLGKRYTFDVKGKKLSQKGKAQEILKAETTKLENKIKSKKLTNKEAFALLDKLVCLS